MSESPQPQLPCPTKEHEWLQRLVGDWESEVSAVVEPGQPPAQTSGTETIRAVGGFWVVNEIDGKCPMTGGHFQARQTLGFDPKSQKYIGTWVDSMTSTLFTYEGAMDATGNVLTMFTEGACPMTGQNNKIKETTELRGDDRKIFTAYMQGEDGAWNQMLQVSARRIR